MERRTVITLVVTALWMIISSPYLAATLLFAHGHHRITSEFENGAAALVFHHDGEDSDHHHPDHHQDKDDHSQNGDDHHLAVIQAVAATSHSLSTQNVTKYIPVIPFASFITALAQGFALDVSHNLLINKTVRIATPFFSLRTIVLLV